MTTNSLGAQKTYRAYLAHFLYSMSATVDTRISHQLLANAQTVQGAAGLTDAQASAIIDQAHAAAKAEQA